MIEVKNLSKRFRQSETARSRKIDVRESKGWFNAVRNVSFQCGPGEVLGLLGPNGAGKTTTLRLLSTALTPDSGSVNVNGIDVVAQPKEARRRIGYLSGSTGLYGRLTARENVEYSGRLHGIRGAELERRCDAVFETLQMNEFAHKRAHQLSAGMKQKCAIARTVLHEPEVIVLDEPTTGLDVMAAKVLLDFIANYKRIGIPLIFSTHHLHEVEKLCDRVCIINRGATAFHGTTADLQQMGGGSLFDAFIQIVNEEP